MIVPAYYSELLKKRDTFGYLASLNEKQLCDVCRSNGVYLVNQEYLRIIYMHDLSPRVLQNLQANPQLTVTIVSAYTFECYQFKGKYISHEEMSIKDEKFKDTYLKGMVEVIGELGFNMEKVLNEKYVKLAAKTIIMKVEEIFNQTPKKGTGNLVEPLNQTI